ncbi:hypothetical protein V2J94_44830 [Streptomyces sp. DSM 41524]|uniref:Uncharacterized protein n=1 Tax=Streptomyces asiaticus subsp. ignotus TaxID=3098222 RepID=A0ABU7QE25_9ACTN|nr:hypothetical protein [Streptomyces sp. DSM 41524]
MDLQGADAAVPYLIRDSDSRSTTAFDIFLENEGAAIIEPASVYLA